MDAPNNHIKNCWDFRNCPEHIRKQCEVYRMKMGKECWFLQDMDKGGMLSKDRPGGCFLCAYFEATAPADFIQ